MAAKLITSPKGVAIWPKLNEADTKYNAAGVYEVKLALDATDPSVVAMQSKVDDMIDEKYDEVVAEITQKLTEQGKKGLIAKAVAAVSKSSPFKAEEDPETGEETGRVIVKFKKTASGVSKKTGKPWKSKPDIFNAKGVKLAAPPKIGGGSTLKVSYEPFPYYAANDKSVGVSFRMEGVQIIDLVTFGARDAGEHGFGEEEGYDGDGDTASNDFGDETTDNSLDADDDL